MGCGERRKGKEKGKPLEREGKLLNDRILGMLDNIEITSLTRMPIKRSKIDLERFLFKTDIIYLPDLTKSILGHFREF